MTRDLSGWGRGLDGDACLFRSRVGSRRLRGLGQVGAKVRQGQGDGPNVVDSQQNLQGADLLEGLIGQSLTGPLDLLYTRRERTDPTSCGQRETSFSSGLMLISLATILVLTGTGRSSPSQQSRGLRCVR